MGQFVPDLMGQVYPFFQGEGFQILFYFGQICFTFSLLTLF